ncbi:MAG: hypothetical protein JNL96_17245 [Planctomycetaceae bacterium]|nr:hypothetical protein [Planctomycetaceae bacterium]
MANVTKDSGLAPPKAGDKFKCESCGMELQITKDCHCSGDDHVHFHCCGKEMVKA